MTPREIIAALMAAIQDGYDDGDVIIQMPPTGCVDYRLVGDAIHLRFDPAIGVARSGIFHRVANGQIRRAEITHDGVRVWIDGVAILGTVEREYRV